MRRKNNKSLIIVGLAVILCLSCVIQLLGYKPYTVTTESMMPTIKKGDLIFIKQAEIDDLYENDIITYVVDKSLNVATHRIIDIDFENCCFYTKGDNNQYADAVPVFYKNIIGKCMFKIPFIGYWSMLIARLCN